MKLKSSTGQDQQVALLSGYCIVVPADSEGVEVPKMFQQEAFKLGCVPIEVDLDDEPEKVGPPEGAEKTKVIVEAMKKMLDAGCKLTGSGLPNLNDLRGETGFPVNKTEAAEAWNVLEAETEGND